MSWHSGRLAAFDVESTGIDPRNDRIVTATVSLVGGDLPVETVSWLADPGVEIPAGATNVHGVTTEQARADGRPATEVVDEIAGMLAKQVGANVPLIAFNARYDLTMLDRETRRHGLAALTDRFGPDELIVIDPLVIDKQVDRFRRGKRTLAAMCGHYGVQFEETHAADADAIAAARLAWKIAQAYPEIGEADPRALHEQQIDWAADQARSLEEYFKGQGRDEHVEPAWPIILTDD